MCNTLTLGAVEPVVHEDFDTPFRPFQAATLLQHLTLVALLMAHASITLLALCCMAWAIVLLDAIKLGNLCYHAAHQGLRGGYHVALRLTVLSLFLQTGVAIILSLLLFTAALSLAAATQAVMVAILPWVAQGVLALLIMGEIGVLFAACYTHQPWVDHVANLLILTGCALGMFALCAAPALALALPALLPVVAAACIVAGSILSWGHACQQSSEVLTIDPELFKKPDPNHSHSPSSLTQPLLQKR